MARGRRLLALATAMLLGSLVGVAGAAPPALEAADLDAFFDGALGGLMRERHVPGAVVLVVKDGAVVFAEGYGAADLETGRPVDPETTLFRVASVSKLFTATAVMQLVEQRRLDLDADVNTYLESMQVPATFEDPITLRHLLTHTPGLDDGFLHGSEPLDAPSPMPLAEALRRFLPARVRPPGELLSYSNHGLALAGLVVEEASGQPLRDYLREHVLGPLGMTHSGFSLPNPPPPELAVGYDWQDGRYVPATLDRMRWFPAGDLYTSAGEISRFMLAHLANGEIPGGGGRILREETARAMHAQAFTHHPALVGWCLGFDELVWNDVRVVSHGGSWNGFGTALILIPEANAGLFVSSTRDNDPRFFRPLLRAFFDRYFPPTAPRTAPAPGDGAIANGRAVAGRYVPNRHVRGDVLKLGLLLGSAQVAVEPDGALRVTSSDPDGMDPIRALETAGGYWQSDRDETRIAFLRGGDGEQHMVVNSWTFDRVPWWRDPELHKLLLGACALVFATTVLGWGLGAVARRTGRQSASPLPRGARGIGSLAAGLSLAALVAVLYGLSALSPFALFIEIPGWLRAAGLLPLLSIPLSLGVAWWLARSRGWPPLARIHYTVLTLALAVYAALAWSYNLIGIG